MTVVVIHEYMMYLYSWAKLQSLKVEGDKYE